jgi:leucyl aminopeptidase
LLGLAPQAVSKGIKRAISAGAKKPLLVLPGTLVASRVYAQALQASLVAALSGCYCPLSIRTFKGEAAAEPVTAIPFYWTGPNSGDVLAMSGFIKNATAIEQGRRVARDIAGGDPEAMAPPRIVEYLKEAFAGTGVVLSVVEETSVINSQFPLVAAVARASLHTPRHAPRIVRLEYNPPDAAATRQVVLVVGVLYFRIWSYHLFMVINHL